MRVLFTGSDQSALVSGSALATRIARYGALVDAYVGVVPSQQQTVHQIDETTMVYGTGRTKGFKKWIALYKQLAQLASDGSYDVMTAQDPYAYGFVARCVAKRYHLGLEIQVHGWGQPSWVKRVVSRFVLARASHIRTVSQRMKREILSVSRRGEADVAVVSVHTPSVGVEYKRSYTRSEPYIFLTVGRLVPVKCIDIQLQAFAKCLELFPDCELHIVGQGVEESRLRSLAATLGISDRVRFLGQRSSAELDTIYTQADCFVLTSAQEGWGLVVIEAAFHGLPIIMTDVGCAGEVIVSGTHGIVIAPHDVEACTQAMGEMISSEQKRTAYGTAAQQAVQQLPSKQENDNAYRASWQDAAKYPL